jgi:ribosome-binding factor A
MDARRSQRVSETLREELSEIIAFEMSDPRLDIVDVTGVQVAPDLRHAHVSVGLHGDSQRQEQAMAALEHARHYLRHELARRLNLRRVPELHFQADLWTEVDSRVETLLKRAKKNRGLSDENRQNQP